MMALRFGPPYPSLFVGRPLTATLGDVTMTRRSRDVPDRARKRATACIEKLRLGQLRPALARSVTTGATKIGF